MEQKEILNGFLDRWTIDHIKNMTLEEYVGLGNKDTFCQWVETKTKMLGSINGMPSIKFGIYERKDSIQKPKNYQNDNKYSWLRRYGDNKQSAFNTIKQYLIKIIQLSEIGEFKEIEKIFLPNLFKWKVAFLYSNERLIPIYKKDLLVKIANSYNLQADGNTAISEIQNVMILNKPIDLNVYDFMIKLYEQFGKYINGEKIVNDSTQKKQKRIKRKAANKRNTDPQTITSKSSYTTYQKHNKIQEALKDLLVKQYGKKNVILEENYVDVKLIQPDYISFYEVKSYSYASDCIKEALGQLLLYSLNDHDDTRPKRHIVVGQYPATDNDKKYIDFLKKNLKLKFEYQDVKIE